jgi:hypothetical protein
MLDLCEYCYNCEEKEQEYICEIHEDTSECEDFEFNVNQLF